MNITGSTLSLAAPLLHIAYLPEPPYSTIRQIFDAVTMSNPAFRPSVYHSPTLEERARAKHAAERRRTLRQLIVGHATRLGWALFALATPVYVYSANSFHIQAFKELRAMWRLGSRTPMLHRFTHFGSMNMLMSLGTRIALLASIAELALAATEKSNGSMDNSYFDAVVFLTMFLLIGRFLEALGKAKTGDAVTSLGTLRPDKTVLVDSSVGDTKVLADLLEVGDAIRVYHGTSPPFDGVILDGSSSFDESSLTGESHIVKKDVGDNLYSGMVNKAVSVKVKVTTISGTSMLDEIINAVREG